MFLLYVPIINMETTMTIMVGECSPSGGWQYIVVEDNFHPMIPMENAQMIMFLFYFLSSRYV